MDNENSSVEGTIVRTIIRILQKFSSIELVSNRSLQHFGHNNLTHNNNSMMIKISSNDVPSYLRDGSLFETLDSTDTEQFEVPADCYKQDTSVLTPSDLRFLIRSLRFWTVDDLPVNAIFFSITNDDSELAKISTEFPEYDRWWKMIAELKTYPSEETIEAAIRVGFPLTVLRELRVRGDFALTAKTCVAAAASSTVEMLTYLHQQGCPWDTDTTDAATRAGNLSCLMYAHENGCGLSPECLNIAAAAGQLASIKYLHSVGVPIHQTAFECAAMSLNLEVIQYLCKSGCVLPDSTCEFFALHGSLECLKYAHERGCPWGVYVCANAALVRSLPCVEYAHVNGCPWDSHTTTSAASAGCLECLQYAHRRGCPLDHSAMDGSIQAGSWECFWYTLQNRCISSDLFQIVIISIVFALTMFHGTLNTFHPTAACQLVECSLNLFGKRVLSRHTFKTLHSINHTFRVGVTAVVLYQLFTGGDLSFNFNKKEEK